MTHSNNITTSIPNKQERNSYDTRIINAIHKRYGHSTRTLRRYLSGDIESTEATKILEEYNHLDAHRHNYLDDYVNGKIDINGHNN